MRSFDDYTIHEIKEENKIEYVAKYIYERCKKGEIKDILIVARTTDTKEGKYGLPQNIIDYCSVTDDYELDVFSRFATDKLIHQAKCISGKAVFDGVLKELKQDGHITDDIIEKFKNK